MSLPQNSFHSSTSSLENLHCHYRKEKSKKQQLTVKPAFQDWNHTLPPYFSPDLFSSVFSSHGFDTTIFYQPQVQPVAKPCQLCLHVALTYALPSLHLTALLPRPPSALPQTAAMAHHVGSAPFNLFSTSTCKSAHSSFSTLWWFFSALRIKCRPAYEALRGSPTASLQPQHILTLPSPVPSTQDTSSSSRTSRIMFLLPYLLVPPFPFTYLTSTYT